MAGKTFFDDSTSEDTRDLRFIPADPTSPRTLTSLQVEQFNEEGFLNGLPAFDGKEIERIRRYFDDLIESVLSADDRRNSYSINAYHLVCAGLYDLLLSPVLLDYVEDLLGPDFACWGNHLFCKLPRDPMEVPLHQDGAYWPITPSRTVTVWLALDDADKENAAMEFVPGSHLGGALPHADLPLDGTRVLKRQVVDPKRYGERFINALRAGQISLHSDMLLHGSGLNRSDRRRAGMTFRYAAAEVRPLPGHEYWFRPGVHCRGTLPEHWPHRRRPAGENPEKLSEFVGEFDGNPLKVAR
jgi:non-heme Fe2+,alpha-ketoglutarate-dependent halogenase